MVTGPVYAGKEAEVSVSYLEGTVSERCSLPSDSYIVSAPSLMFPEFHRGESMSSVGLHTHSPYLEQL